MRETQIPRLPWIAVVALLAAGAGLSRAGASPALRSGQAAGTVPSTIRFAKNPSPVPDFTVRDLSGNTITPAAWRGKVTLVNFWATWCEPCREEIPELIKLQAKYPGSLEVIGFSVDEEPAERVKQFVRQAGINYPVAIVDEQLQAKFGGVMALPTAFLVNRDGGIVQKHVGFSPSAVYETEVRALLDLPVDAKIETFEDRGEVFLPNAARATELPGVSFAKLTPEQKRAALRKLNSERCTCGCTLTLAQCRIVDTACPVSLGLAREMVEKIAGNSSAAGTSGTKK